MGLFRRNKNNNKLVIRQILDLAPRWLFDNCTKTYKTDKDSLQKTDKYKIGLQYNYSLYNSIVYDTIYHKLVLVPLKGNNTEINVSFFGIEWNIFGYYR